MGKSKTHQAIQAVQRALKGKIPKLKTLYFFPFFILLIALASYTFVFNTTKPAQAAGNTYYVDATNGNDSNLGTSELAPWKTIAKVNAKSLSAGDKILFARGQIWSGTRLNPPSSGSPGNPIVYGDYGTGEKPAIDQGTALAHSAYIGGSKHDIKLQNLRFTGTASYNYHIYLDTVSNITIEGCESSFGGRSIYATVVTNLQITHSIFTESANGVTLENSTGSIQYSIFRGAPTNDNSNGHPGTPLIVTGTSSNVAVNNCISTGTKWEPVLVGAGATVAINNSIILAKGSLYTVINSGVTNINNTLWLPGWAAFYGLKNVTDVNGVNPNNFIPLPYWQHNARESIFQFQIDDIEIDYAIDMAKVLEPYGFHLTFFINPSRITQKADWQNKLKALVYGDTVAGTHYGINGGHEIGSHSYSHPNLLNLRAFTVSKPGETITIATNQTGDSSAWTGTLTTSGGLNINLAQAPNNTFAGLMTTLTAAGYTVTTDRSAGYGDSAKAITLANVINQSINAPYNVMADQTAFYTTEIAETKSWIENQIGGGYTVKTFSYPGGYTNDTVANAVQAAGYIGGRGDNSDAITVGDSKDLANLRIYGWSHNIDIFSLQGDGTKATIRRNTAGLVEAFLENGISVNYLSHSASETSLQHLAWIAEVVKESKIDEMTFGEACNYIRTSGLWIDADGNGKRWVRAFTDDSDYRLLSNSPAIDAGTNVGLTTDLAGNPIYGAPDMGAYEYQPPHIMGTNGIDIGAGARVYGDGKFRDLNTTSSATADLKVTPQSGSFSSYGSTEVRPAWMDIISLTWSNVGTHHKAWTESSSTLGATTTLHTIGDLEANKNYNVSVDGTLGWSIAGTNGTVCTNGLCKSNSQGKISFIYSGGYSTHVFDVTEGDNTPPIISNITSNHANGTFGAGTTIDIDLTFSENVTSVGNVTVHLNTGGSCSFSVSNASSASCNYIVAPAENSSDLNVRSVSGEIRDEVGNAMTVFTPEVNLASNKNIVINTLSPPAETPSNNISAVQPGSHWSYILPTASADELQNSESQDLQQDDQKDTDSVKAKSGDSSQETPTANEKGKNYWWLLIAGIIALILSACCYLMFSVRKRHHI